MSKMKTKKYRAEKKKKEKNLGDIDKSVVYIYGLLSHPALKIRAIFNHTYLTTLKFPPPKTCHIKNH